MQPQMPQGPSIPPQDPRGPQPQQPQQAFNQAGQPTYQPPAPGQFYPPYQPPMPQYQPPAGYTQQQSTGPVPLPPPPPMAKTPYDFFMQQKHPVNTKLPIPGPRHAGFKGKIIWVVGAGVAVVLILSLFSLLLPKDTSVQGLATIAQTQQEVARMCGLGTAAKAQANRNFAITCNASIISDQRKLLTYLGTVGYKPDAKVLSLLTNAKTDQQLKSASSTSTFDETFVTLAETKLVAYGNMLSQQLASPELGIDSRAVLDTAFEHNKVLLAQVQVQTGTQTQTAAPAMAQ